MVRHDGRAPDQLRPLQIDTKIRSWAEGAAMITSGATTVLCTATVEERVPPHRRGSRAGWVTAEYGMLPRATHERNPRDRGGKVDGRAQEIQRLVARSLRSAVNLRHLGERTVTIDCDVIHADGGTRTTAISGGFVALALACRRLQEAGMVTASPIVRAVAAVSVGLVDGTPLLDLDYREDSMAATDMNVVMSAEGQIIEIQGTAEREPFSQNELGVLINLARGGIADLVAAQSLALGSEN
ncbi:MAG TPA: ribonuclease PH [Candidatus Saccharimonadales bacterium]|nr:ribonuclease PH [Candidatus Saccharimonadales bacterium]